MGKRQRMQIERVNNMWCQQRRMPLGVFVQKSSTYTPGQLLYIFFFLITLHILAPATYTTVLIYAGK